jgi:hypothetical protein
VQAPRHRPVGHDVRLTPDATELRDSAFQNIARTAEHAEFQNFSATATLLAGLLCDEAAGRRTFQEPARRERHESRA